MQLILALSLGFRTKWAIQNLYDSCCFYSVLIAKPLHKFLMKIDIDNRLLTELKYVTLFMQQWYCNDIFERDFNIQTFAIFWNSNWHQALRGMFLGFFADHKIFDLIGMPVRKYKVLYAFLTSAIYHEYCMCLCGCCNGSQFLFFFLHGITCVLEGMMFFALFGTSEPILTGGYRLWRYFVFIAIIMSASIFMYSMVKSGLIDESFHSVYGLHTLDSTKDTILQVGDALLAMAQ